MELYALYNFLEELATIRMADPGKGMARTSGMAAPGNGGPREWRPLGMAAPGNGGPREWQPPGMADLGNGEPVPIRE
jgi:hypothetical protein